MLKFKEKPEYFIVNEIAKFKFKEQGKFGIFCLKKKGLTTEEAVARIARKLSIDPKNIGYAGLKDKQAVTFQFVSIPGFSNDLKESNFELIFLGFSDEPIDLGYHISNQFVITVYTDLKPRNVRIMPNYFDGQRFSGVNAEVGFALIKKDFRQAVKLIAERDLVFKESKQQHLKDHPNDYVNCLSVIPRRLLLLYLHSFQSLLFNRALDRYVRQQTSNFYEQEIAGFKFAFPREGLKNIRLPLMGFAITFNEETKALYKPLLEEYSIAPIDFIIREIPWLTEEGSYRDAFTEIKKLNITQLNIDTYQLNFFLDKGAYATIAIKSIFQPA